MRCWSLLSIELLIRSEDSSQWKNFRITLRFFSLNMENVKVKKSIHFPNFLIQKTGSLRDYVFNISPGKCLLYFIIF